jgi:SAM-dependent methyltransferase
MREHKPDSIPYYMERTIAHIADCDPGMRILDIPAGDGTFTKRMRKLGHQVTPADIKLREQDYVHADMNKTLPFPDGHFDGVVCLEGLEHLLNPFVLLGELIRVTRVGGHVVVTTPNIMNMYSRFQFLLTGTFYQFHPAQLHDVRPDEERDRFHISPMSYHRIRYLAEYFGATVDRVYADRGKRRFLMPLYGLAYFLGKPWSRSLFFSRKYSQYRERNGEIYQDVNSGALLFGRSLILVLKKEESATSILDRRMAA